VGTRRRLTEAARANMLSTEEAHRGVVLSLVATVATSYLQLRGLDEQLAIAERTQATYAESLRVMELKFQYGRVSQMNVDQARARYETASVQVPRLRREIAILENGLSALLGRSPGSIPRGKVDLRYRRAAGSGRRSVTTAGASSRYPPGRAATRRSERADRRRQGAVFPNDFADRRSRQRQHRPVRPVHWTGRHLELRRRVRGPILCRRGIRGQVVQAEAARKAALLSYQRAIQNAFADVDNALVTRSTLADQVASQAKLVEALRGYESMAQMQYDVGRAPYSTVLQAQEQLFQPSWMGRGARPAVRVTAGVYKAMGGGGWTRADQMTTSAADRRCRTPAQ